MGGRGKLEAQTMLRAAGLACGLIRQCFLNMVFLHCTSGSTIVRCLACSHSQSFANMVFCTILVDAGFARVLARSHSQCFANTVFCTILVDAGSARVLALSQGHGFVNMVCYYFITVGNEPGARRNIAVSSFKV